MLDHDDYEEYDYKENIEEDPLPAGPTRRPDQPFTLPLKNDILVNPVLSQLASLPLLTTKKPAVVHGTTRKPRTHFGLLSSKDGKVGSLLVHSSMDVVDQTRLFANMDPFQEQFINPPKLNAGIFKNLYITFYKILLHKCYQVLCLSPFSLEKASSHLLIRAKMKEKQAEQHCEIFIQILYSFNLFILN